jgi:hypothetical protein
MKPHYPNAIAKGEQFAVALRQKKKREMIEDLRKKRLSL